MNIIHYITIRYILSPICQSIASELHWFVLTLLDVLLQQCPSSFPAHGLSMFRRQLKSAVGFGLPIHLAHRWEWGSKLVLNNEGRTEKRKHDMHFPPHIWDKAWKSNLYIAIWYFKLCGLCSKSQLHAWTRDRLLQVSYPLACPTPTLCIMRTTIRILAFHFTDTSLPSSAMWPDPGRD